MKHELEPLPETRTLSKVHISAVRDYETCPRLFRLAWVEGLVPKQLDMRLHLGSAVHEGLQAYYKGEDAAAAFTRYVARAVLECTTNGVYYDHDAVQERANVGLDLLDAYIKWAEQNDPVYRAKVVLVEHNAVVPIVNPYTGEETGICQDLRVDAVWEDHYGHLWLVEHKTTGSGFPTEDWLRLDIQTGSYILALEQMFPDMRVVGVLHNYLRVPREGGTVAGMKSDKVRRFRVIWNKTMRQRLRERLYRSCMAMLSDGVNDPRPQLCKHWSCRFAPVCLAMEDGSDVEALKTALYLRKEVT